MATGSAAGKNRDVCTAKGTSRHASIVDSHMISVTIARPSRTVTKCNRVPAVNAFLGSQSNEQKMVFHNFPVTILITFA